MEAENRTEALVQKAKEGDRAAFRRLAQRYEARLLRLVRSRLGSGLDQKIDASDVVQDTFLRALEALGGFWWQGEDSFFRWLTRIATNSLRQTARRQKRMIIVPLLDRVEANSLTQSRALRRHERFDRLQEALDELSREHRQVILLARVERLPMKEVARRMRRTTAATSQLLWRAMKSLREHFGDTESLHLPDRRLGDRGDDHGN